MLQTRLRRAAKTPDAYSSQTRFVLRLSDLRFRFFQAVQRESSAARAHDTIGAGRLKRLLGARFRRRVSGSFFRAADARFASRPRVLSFVVSAAASGGSRVMRAHSSTRPLDLTPRHLLPRPSLSFVVLCSFLLHPT